VTGVPIVDLATQAALGKKLKDMGYGINLYQPKDIVAAKVPVFSFEKLPLVEASLGPEMKSTGEVLGLGKNLSQALYKGFLGAGYNLQKGKYILFSVANKDKQEVIDLAWECKEIGFNILATEGTAQVLAACGIDINVLHKESISHGCIDKYFQDGVISAVINTPTRGRDFCREGFILRRKAIEHSVPCITSLDTAKAFIESLKVEMEEKIMDITSIEKIV
jgi:carbamoyl-phosphate synthase large subunit